jgi:hypothetical protein
MNWYADGEEMSFGYSSLKHIPKEALLTSRFYARMTTMLIPTGGNAVTKYYHCTL